MSSDQKRNPGSSGASAEVRMFDQFLETNGLGGYSSTTISGIRLWPSQGMVVIAKQPPIDRYVLVNGFNAWAEIDGVSIPLTSNQFKDDRVEPDSRPHLLRFEGRPWPHWTFDLGKGRVLGFETFTRHGTNQFVFSWHLQSSDQPVTLRVRPLLSGRPMDSTRTETSKMSLQPERPSPRQFTWALRAGAPPLSLLSDGDYVEDPKWICDFRYDNHSTEDLASPCEFRWTLQPRERAHILACTAEELNVNPRTANEVAYLADKLRNAERTRRKLFRTELDRAADQYIVNGQDGRTLLSGFPRGTEMGERTMIALRGICLSPGRLDLASDLLATWRRRIAAGMLPEEISEHRLKSTFTSPAPSLWYILATFEYIRAAYRQGRILQHEERDALLQSIDSILRAFRDRSNHAAFMDEDGLLAETESVPVTEGAPAPGRTIKRVAVQALWIASLRVGDRLNGGWKEVYEVARREFDRTFWQEESGYLHKAIIETPNQPLERLSQLSMEQVLAVGGLPIACVDEGRASLIVHALEAGFATHESVRSAPSLPWHFGPFIEAWFRVRFHEPDVLEQVKHRFLIPWQEHLQSGGLNHLPEHHPFPVRGRAPSQARQTPFSSAETSELLRILHLPDLHRGQDPFDDRLSGECFYD